VKLSQYPKSGKFGTFGGRYVPEILYPALEELERAYEEYKANGDFEEELRTYNRDYGGDPLPFIMQKD